MSESVLSDNKAASKLGNLITTLEYFNGVTLVIMMVLTFVDVIGRYLFSAPVFGASEMISALLAFVVFSGLGIANARDRHIVVELFDEPIRRIAPRLYDVVIQGFSVLAMLLITFVLLEAAWEAYRDSARTIVLELPTVLIVATVSLLAVLSVIAQIAGIVLRMSDTFAGRGP